jgi:hypothetical protein
MGNPVDRVADPRGQVLHQTPANDTYLPQLLVGAQPVDNPRHKSSPLGPLASVSHPKSIYRLCERTEKGARRWKVKWMC